MCTWPVVISVSTATRLRGSWASIASRIESLIWSAILSGWPSVTDSDVKRRRLTNSPDVCDGSCRAEANEGRRPCRFPAPYLSGKSGNDGVTQGGGKHRFRSEGDIGLGPVGA